jgi:hypothetical protein
VDHVILESLIRNRYVLSLIVFSTNFAFQKPTKMYSNKTLIGNWSADRENTLAPTVQAVPAEIPSVLYPEVGNFKSFPEIPVDDKLKKMEPKKVVSLQKDVPITKSGVVDDKMEECDLDKKPRRQVSGSAYKQDFKAPEAADYAFKRYSKHNN